MLAADCGTDGADTALMWRSAGLAVLAMAALLTGCGDREERLMAPTNSPTTTSEETPPPERLRLTSREFDDGAPIPDRYSCHGDNVPPPLAWTGAPERAAELALIVDDPDAVGGLFTHWVVVGIEPSRTGGITESPPEGVRVTANSGGKSEYLGPCPPAGTGTHHYRFTLYALPNKLDVDTSAPVKEVTATIRAAASTSARLVGTYDG
jgi:Raf kinase inhibitor-like YbhB/YbcL family protein